MASPAERFFNGLFDEKDFTSLTKNTSVAMTTCGVAWLGTVFIPTKTGELSHLKSGCFVLALLAGGISIFFATKREKPLRKKTVLTAIEDNDFIEKTGVITGLNAELTAQHLEQCLQKVPNDKTRVN